MVIKQKKKKKREKSLSLSGKGLLQGGKKAATLIYVEKKGDSWLGETEC